MSPNITRRQFLKSAGSASAGAVAFPHVMRSRHGPSPNGKLNIALVGVGGRGYAAVMGTKGENQVAFCDVDDARAARAHTEFPNVPRFRDYRRMLDKLGNSIDAVTVSTPDHMHYPIAMAALSLGKHVFVEKPLSHTIWEARQLAKLAAESNVATQMGNQGHANEGTRMLKEWLQAGVIGEVRELHSWTDRPVWPQGVNAPDHAKYIPVAPQTLDWDLWLGVAAPRDYDPAYLPFSWRGYWDFGTGALGDMGCHVLDGGFWGLDLDAPSRVEAISARQGAVSGPTASMITFHFDARGGSPPLKWTWYDGGLEPLPPDDFGASRKLIPNGTLIVGSKATILASVYSDSMRIIPEARMKEIAPALPPKTFPRVSGDHFAEWLRACKGGPQAGSHFGYAARLTEMCLLGNIAIRARRSLTWDAPAMKVTNLPEANEYITKEYRPGFGI